MKPKDPPSRNSENPNSSMLDIGHGGSVKLEILREEAFHEKTSKTRDILRLCMTVVLLQYRAY